VPESVAVVAAAPPLVVAADDPNKLVFLLDCEVRTLRLPADVSVDKFVAVLADVIAAAAAAAAAAVDDRVLR